MQRAGVPILPGSEGTGVTELKDAQADAKRLGYPVLIKAAAGGGGKGCGWCATRTSSRDYFRLARAESEAAFGSRTMYLEKYLERARHVEFQILADNNRDVIHLGERDCSIQRRHQKVLEEAPCPIMTKRLREKMGKAAVRAAEVVGYSKRRHGGISARSRRPVSLYRDEHADPGRAWRDRDGDLDRLVKESNPNRGGRAAGLEAAPNPVRGRGDRMPDIRRGSRTHLPSPGVVTITIRREDSACAWRQRCTTAIASRCITIH